MIKLYEDKPLRLDWDDNMLKIAYRICVNNNWTHIPTPDEIRALPSLWLDDLFSLQDEVKRQLSHLKANLPEG